jgi:hypothetical protein
MTKQQRHIPKARLFIAAISISLICVAAAIWILNGEHIIQGHWTSILPIIFIALAVLVPLIQWLFPLPSSEAEPPLSSNLILIDAALDPHDSPYEQNIENGRTKIRFKGEKPKKVGRDKRA